MKYSSAQIHTRNMKIYRERLAQHKLIRARLVSGLLIGCGFITFMALYTKFSYEFIENIKVEAQDELLSPQPRPTPIPSPTVKPVEIQQLTSTNKTEKQQILAYIVDKFGDDSADFITLINKCENHKFDQNATNVNRNSTVDYGVAQINSIHIPHCGEGIKTDWKQNIDCAYEVYKAAGYKFTPWTCAPIVNQANYLGER